MKVGTKVYYSGRSVFPQYNKGKKLTAYSKDFYLFFFYRRKVIATFRIAKINTVRGLGGLVNYANDIAHKNTVIIASAGVSTTSNATIEFQGTGSDASFTEEFRGHISLSFHPDDTP